MNMTNRSNQIIAALGIALLPLGIETSSAQTELLAIEFNEDDQDGFDLWPSALGGAGTETFAEFATDASLTSGTTTLTLMTNTSFNVPANRGNLTDGTPEGFTYTGLYQDLLHAGSPTGFLTMAFSGLNPDQVYRFTLYAWDPGATDASDKEWTVTEGSADPSVLSVNFQDPLVDNESFALVFDVTTTATGTFTVVNTNGLPQSAVNGFRLESLGAPAPFTITEVDYSSSDSMITLTWDSKEGELYAVKYSSDMTDWGGDLDDGVEGDAGETTTRTYNLALAGLAGAERVYFRVERVAGG